MVIEGTIVELIIGQLNFSYLLQFGGTRGGKLRREWALADSGWRDTSGKPVKRKAKCPKGGFIWKEDVFRLALPFGEICQGHKQNFFDKFISSLFLS